MLKWKTSCIPISFCNLGFFCYQTFLCCQTFVCRQNWRRVTLAAKRSFAAKIWIKTLAHCTFPSFSKTSNAMLIHTSSKIMLISSACLPSELNNHKIMKNINVVWCTWWPTRLEHWNRLLWYCHLASMLRVVSLLSYWRTSTIIAISSGVGFLSIWTTNFNIDALGRPHIGNGPTKNVWLACSTQLGSHKNWTE